MGNIVVSNSDRVQKKIPKLTEDEIIYYERETLFNAYEILQLHKAFRRHSSIDASIEEKDFTDIFFKQNRDAKGLGHLFRIWNYENNGNLSK